MDHIGSVTDVTDAASTGVGRYAFDPWGRRTPVAGADVTTVGFTGHRSLGTSVSLTLHRAYDADLGRWLSEDPIGLSDGPNLYAYVENRVTAWIDPLGLKKCCDQLQQRRKRLTRFSIRLILGESRQALASVGLPCALAILPTQSTPISFENKWARASRNA